VISNAVGVLQRALVCPLALIAVELSTVLAIALRITLVLVASILSMIVIGVQALLHAPQTTRLLASHKILIAV